MKIAKFISLLILDLHYISFQTHNSTPSSKHHLIYTNQKHLPSPADNYQPLFRVLSHTPWLTSEIVRRAGW